MGRDTTTMKVSTLILNTILIVLAVVLFVFVIIDSDRYTDAITTSYYVLCPLVVVVAVIGGIAVLFKFVHLSIVYAILVLVLAILQTTVICLNLNENQSVDNVSMAWNNSQMDQLQTEYKCCGKDSAQDYVLMNKNIPASCYAHHKIGDESALYISGCTIKVDNDYGYKKTRLFIISWVLVGFEILGFILGIYLAISFRNEQRRMQF